MKLKVNGEAYELATGTSLQSLVDALGFNGRKGMALAVNEAVVPLSAWAETTLSEGDAVLVIQATQGG